VKIREKQKEMPSKEMASPLLEREISKKAFTMKIRDLNCSQVIH